MSHEANQTRFNYRLHFGALVFAVGALAFLSDPITDGMPFERFHTYFALVGLLNSAAWVVALPASTPFERRFAFLLCAMGLSIFAVYSASSRRPFCRRRRQPVRISDSFLGTLSVRRAVHSPIGFWFAASGCRDSLCGPTHLWWVAFSLSIWIADRGWLAMRWKRRPAVAELVRDDQ